MPSNGERAKERPKAPQARDGNPAGLSPDNRRREEASEVRRETREVVKEAARAAPTSSRAIATIVAYGDTKKPSAANSTEMAAKGKGRGGNVSQVEEEE